MAIQAPAVRKYLSADALFGGLRTGFADIAAHRLGKPDMTLTDALMSAFAMVSLTSPSLLAFDQERTTGNLQRVYGLQRVPCDTAMRAMLDPVKPQSLRPLFQTIFRALPRGKRWRRGCVSRAITCWPLMVRASFLPNRCTVSRVERGTTAMAPSRLPISCGVRPSSILIGVP